MRGIVWRTVFGLFVCIHFTPFIQIAQGAKVVFYDDSSLQGDLVRVTDDKIFLNQNSVEIERPRDLIVSIEELSPKEEALLIHSPELSSLKKAEFSSVHPSPVKENIEQSAYDSLLLFKEKLKLKHEKEKEGLVQSFKDETLFLEENLELLANRYAELKQDFTHEQEKVSSLSAHLEASKQTILDYEQERNQLKKELTLINEARLKSEVGYSEKLQKALTRDKNRLRKEKQALINSYEGRISELVEEQNHSNLKLLELATEKSNLSAKLSNMEQLSDQTGGALSALEIEFSNHKKAMAERIVALEDKNKKDRVSLEKMLSSSAEALASLKNEKKMILDENAFLKAENDSARMDLQSAEKQISFLEGEKERFRKETLKSFQHVKKLKEKQKMEQEHLLKSLIESVLTDNDQNTIPGLSQEVHAAILKAKKTGKFEAQTGRSALFSLFQKDITQLSDDLDVSKEKMSSLKTNNLSLKTDLQKMEFELKEMEREKKEARKQAARFQDEKKKMRAEVQNILKEIRSETRSHLETEKKSLRKNYEQVIQNLKEEQQANDNAFPSDWKDTEDFAEDAPLEEAFAVPSKKASPKKTPPPLSKEENFEFEDASETFEGTEGTEEASLLESGGVNVKVGVVSQIEKEFSRVYIDTQEIVAKGDTVYVLPAQGDEVSFTVIKVIEALNGAIAEISDEAKMKSIHLEDVVYVRQ